MRRHLQLSLLKALWHGRAKPGRGILFFQRAARHAAPPLSQRKGGADPADLVLHRNCGLRSGLEDVTPRTLRHSSGTRMAQKGVELWQISGHLGHTHGRTTELYGRHHADFLLYAREALG